VDHEHGAITLSATARDIARKVGQAVVVMVLVSVVVFFAVRLIPGNPAKDVLGTKAAPAAVAALKRELGLDRPLLDQFVTFLKGMPTLNFGHSLQESGVTVRHIVFNGLGITATVVGASTLLSLLIGVPLGLWAALSRWQRTVSHGVQAAAVVLLASPPFLIGLVLIVVLGVDLRWLPVAGWGSSFTSDLDHLVLPAFALSGYLIPLVVRTVRQSALDASRELFVEAAITRGISWRSIMFRHILPNSLLPLITLIGLNVATLLSGAIVIEAVFALPGLGTALDQAVNSLDYTVIEGVAVITAFAVVVTNLSADALYALADPRVRRRV
jgi:peptide/nickel transport system permease protein